MGGAGGAGSRCRSCGGRRSRRKARARPTAADNASWDGADPPRAARPIERGMEAHRLPLRPPILRVLAESFHLRLCDITGDLQLLDGEIDLEVAHHAEEVAPHLGLLRRQPWISATHLLHVARLERAG